MSRAPAIVVMMGPCGTGKSTLGAALAQRLGCTFLEGDHLHPDRNVALMASGTALTDADRWPWLDAIAARIDSVLEQHESAVISCSALARRYRARLTGHRRSILFVYLAVPAAELHARMALRPGHFMPAALLGSQLATLEPPASDENAVTLDGTLPLEGLLEASLAAVRERCGFP